MVETKYQKTLKNPYITRSRRALKTRNLLVKGKLECTISENQETYKNLKKY